MPKPKSKGNALDSDGPNDYVIASDDGVCMILYGLKTCDTCRKALKTLPDAHFVDVRAQAVPEATLARAVETFGARLINTRATTWRGLDDDARALPAAELIAAHPTVMKRPLIVAEGRLHLGWDATVRASLGVA